MIYDYLLNTISTKGAAYLVLLDPDKLPEDKIFPFLRHCEKCGVDGFLVGGSLITNGDFERFIEKIKETTNLPAIIFPGGVEQVSEIADAILYISLISGRNAEHLIGKQVLAAPIIRKKKIEPISTGYMIIESGALTTAEYFSNSLPIPRNKPDIAAATALAAEYLGMKLVYLEAGSGAEMPVPFNMVKAVSEFCTVPIIVGGGIRTPRIAREMVDNGANIIVTGNFFESEENWNLIKNFSEAVHVKQSIIV